jgi:hypothetical protein
VLSSARTRTLNFSILATSRGPCGLDEPRALDGSITYVNKSRSAIAFSCLCSVIWEFFSHTDILCFNVIYYKLLSKKSSYGMQVAKGR